MKISVIIPVYNVFKHIRRCLLSAFNQTYTDIEYIIVNDATPDNSMGIVYEVIAQYPQKDVRIINHPVNKGLGGARNTGVQASSGEYIFFLDSDDEIPPTSIETLTQSIHNKNIDLVIGEIKVLGNKRKAYPLLKLKEGVYCGNKFILNSFLQREWYEMAWNKLIKQTLFTKHNIWFEEGLLHEDTLWSFQIANQIKSLAIIQQDTYYYHIQDNSITQKKTKKNIDDFFYILNEIVEESQNRNLFFIQPSIISYLERLRIFFIKSLLHTNLSKSDVFIQKKRINNLYNSKIWIRKNQSFISLLKEIILSIQIRQKYK